MPRQHPQEFYALQKCLHKCPNHPAEPAQPGYVMCSRCLEYGRLYRYSALSAAQRVACDAVSPLPTSAPSLLACCGRWHAITTVPFPTPCCGRVYFHTVTESPRPG